MPGKVSIIKDKAELFKELESAPWGKVSGIYRDKTDPALKARVPTPLFPRPLRAPPT